MSFKNISYQELWLRETIHAILVEGIMRYILCNYFKFWPVVQEMSYKKNLSGNLATLLFDGAEPVAGIKGTNPVKYF